MEDVNEICLKYFIDVTFVNPKDNNVRYTERTGPIFNEKVADQLCLELLRKRNVVAVKVIVKKSKKRKLL